MTPLGWVHVGFVVVAAVLGAAQLIGRKGDGRHRMVGRWYVVAMLGVNVAALSLYEDGRGFGIFHWLAVASLVTLAGGYVAGRRAATREGARVAHAQWMAGSYGGLIAAGVFQVATHTPEDARAMSVAAAWALSIAGLVALFALSVPRMLRRPAS